MVYASETAISHPPSDFEISNLNGRLNIYRCLAQVSRSWRENARDVFFEELEALTADALTGIIRTFQNERSLALVVSRISFRFEEFRCSTRTRPRPRLLRLIAESDEPGSLTERVPRLNTYHRIEAMDNELSITAQNAHWTRWQADVGQILAMCTSLSEVRIISTYTHPRFYGEHHVWLPPSDMTNENILNGLLYSTKLRSLHLVDPSPILQYGPALASWERLKHLTIILTRTFEDLQNTAFILPKSLVSFRFRDSYGDIPWPLSDLTRCTNLQVLDLGLAVTDATCKAVGFLCVTYQHSLQELTLRSIGGDRSLQYIFDSVPTLHFLKLQRLRFPEDACGTLMFSYFKADVLEYLEVTWLLLGLFTGTREDKWSQTLSYTSMRMLKELVINQDDPDDLRKQALHAVCKRLGITLIYRIFHNPDFLDEEEGEVGEFDVVNI